MTRNLKWWLCVGIVFLAAAGAYVWWQYFRDTWKPPSVVTIDGEEGPASLFPEYMAWMSTAEDGSRQALLLRDGDYMFTEAGPIRYLASDGPTFKMTNDDWSVSFNEKTIALALEKADGQKWLNSASNQQLASLRLVVIPDDIDAGSLAALKRLAGVNPNIDLYVESEAALRQVLPDFEPRAVFIGDDMPLQLLASQPQLETLMAGASKPGSLDFLPTLPKLRRLVLGDWDVAQAGPLPEGLPALESLVIIGGDMADLSALRSAPAGLQELTLHDLDELKDLSGLNKMTGLRALFIWDGDEGISVELPDLASLRQLRWVGLPPTISQKQFADFVSAHPKLAILELPKTESAINLAPLRTLKGLQGLVLGGTYENLEIIQEFTSLHFVGISKDIWDESSAQIAAIRKALPDAVVVRVGSLCLGSGWILLLVPILGFAWRRRISLPLAQQAA
jgi:hypothetical protein